MVHDVEVLADPASTARAAATYVAGRAREVVALRGSFTFAVSGGRTPREMLAELVTLDVPWDQTVVYQVDERVAPLGDPDRNLTGLHSALRGLPVQVHPMPVEAADLEAAAESYAALLPERLDLVHLGLGPDGHTASLVPGDAILDVADRVVANTAGQYQGRRRMTLTFPGLGRADQLLWLVTGRSKSDALRLLLRGSVDIPAGRVNAPASLVMADVAATAV